MTSHQTRGYKNYFNKSWKKSRYLHRRPYLLTRGRASLKHVQALSSGGQAMVSSDNRDSLLYQGEKSLCPPPPQFKERSTFQHEAVNNSLKCSANALIRMFINCHVTQNSSRPMIHLPVATWRNNVATPYERKWTCAIGNWPQNMATPHYKLVIRHSLYDKSATSWSRSLQAREWGKTWFPVCNISELDFFEPSKSKCK